MNSVFLSNEILLFLFLQTTIYTLLLISFIYSITILRNWDFTKSTILQYKLEKRTYLVILIISFTLLVKILLFFYFIFSIDKLSHFIEGAMCAAGIFSLEYGEITLFLKLINLFFIGVWFVLNSLDLKQKDYKYTKVKLVLFIFIFFSLTFEYILDLVFLVNIPINKAVECCSIIFETSSISSKIPFGLDNSSLVILFYIIFVLIAILNIQKKAIFLFLFNILFLYISYFAVTYFFSTYIYELPTHQCPFCMLQSEYYFIGYFIWTSLFLGFFISLCLAIFYKNKGLDMNIFYKLSLIFTTLFVFLVSFFVLKYYSVNGVFL
ncbi:hypothetical protein CRU87_01220 [Aliarcobacter trophiarum LMG 25534]|uniref:Membrane protein n=1 Tax=Aliarcobacter trophiarum LMG 25534 TaxID=1032241 RepID=A0AAD0QIQ6_9BACT|nr:hypothetical protein [Aliarcobacter trophiarum]AXK48186.1 putative membrane protein [Aliarcobacter trophiarum LMG 25534]RXJ93138.1 hypothetical protein CRU87_01220 [Aliarcobacter trophiarum LMG 25534]